MDKIKAFMSDKKNTPIVGAVAGIVLVLVVLFYLKQFGIIGAGGGGTDYASDSGASTTDSMSTPADMSTSGEQPPDGTSVDQASTGASPDGGGGQASPPPAGPADKIPPMLAYRKDPFMGFSGPPKKEDAMMAVLPSLRRIRLAPVRVLPPEEEAVEIEEVLPPQPVRRVAGIMWGSQVKAIIESGGKTYVKMPGEIIAEERVRVERIEPTGVILTTLDTKRPMSIRVNLAGAMATQGSGGQDFGTGEAPPPRGRTRGGPPGGNPTEAPPPGFQ